MILFQKQRLFYSFELNQLCVSAFPKPVQQYGIQSRHRTLPPDLSESGIVNPQQTGVLPGKRFSLVRAT